MFRTKLNSNFTFDSDWMHGHQTKSDLKIQFSIYTKILVN